MAQFIVRPITRNEARERCAAHPHAPSLPNSSAYYFQLTIGGHFMGLAAWGHGVQPDKTPRVLFGDAGRTDGYLELCRFFVLDNAPKNTASKFLATTHRIIRKHLPRIDWLYTYAAGFQGLIGYIYKAAGYLYIGSQKVSSLLWIPSVGLVHAISLHHRYTLGCVNPKNWQGIYPGCKQWCGMNFRYLLFVCDKQAQRRLMQNARFTVQPYPTIDDLQIWTVDHEGKREAIPIDMAKRVPIVKLPSTRRAGSETGTRCLTQGTEAGSTPSSAL